MQDFAGIVARARARTGSRDWAEAADLWAEVTAVNPVNGDYRARLGEARFGAQDYAGAREAYEQALRLGLRDPEWTDDAPPLMPGEIAYRIACCEAAAGEREAAVAALAAALDRGMRDLARIRSDEHWEDLRADQRVRDMAGIIDPGSMSRDDGWRYDLAFLAREIKRLAYAPFAIWPEAEFDRAVAELAAAIPALTDPQILVGMMKLASTRLASRLSLPAQQSEPRVSPRPNEVKPGVHLVRIAALGLPCTASPQRRTSSTAAAPAAQPPHQQHSRHTSSTAATPAAQPPHQQPARKLSAGRAACAARSG